MYSDPISDMLTRIRNAVSAKKTDMILPYSKFKSNLAKLLVEEGFIQGTQELEGPIKTLAIQFKYGPEGQELISGIKRISKPGQRIYLPHDKLPRTNSGFGLTVISTSKGLMTDRRARKEKMGGEVICQVW